MTKLLSRAFNRAINLPDNLQDEVAKQLLEDIKGELKWEKTLSDSQDKLEKLADHAIKEYKEGRTRKIGFDEL